MAETIETDGKNCSLELFCLQMKLSPLESMTNHCLWNKYKGKNNKRIVYFILSMSGDSMKLYKSFTCRDSPNQLTVKQYTYYYPYM